MMAPAILILLFYANSVVSASPPRRPCLLKFNAFTLEISIPPRRNFGLNSEISPTRANSPLM